jgi:hypothetical protein
MRMKQLFGVLSIFAAISVASAQPPEAGVRVGTFTTALPAPAPGAAAADVVFKRHPNAAGKETFAFITSEFSFDGAVVKNAPYYAEAVTETTQQLADGNRISNKNTSLLYRDSDGRTRREDTLKAVGPWASNDEPLQTIFINDPVSKTHLVLDVRNKTVRKMPSPEVRPLPAMAGAAPGMTVQGDFVKSIRIQHAAGADPVGAGHAGIAYAASSFGVASAGPADSENVKTESLGTRMIEGVRADGTRTTVTIAAGAMGNERPIEIVSERWYSPELQTVVMTKRSDPRMGDTVYTLRSISRIEPARSLFEAPADYTAVDEPQFFDAKRIDEKIILERKKD